MYRYMYIDVQFQNYILLIGGIDVHCVQIMYIYVQKW